MKIIWITSLFPSGKDNTKGIYLYRTVKKLSEKFDITTIVVYPSFPPIIQMLEKPKSALKIYKYWRKNFPPKPVPPEGIDGSKIFYIRYLRLPRRFFNHYEGYFAYLKVKKVFNQFEIIESVIHSNWIFPSGQLAFLLYKKFRIPYIVSLLGTDVHQLKYGTIYWRKANLILKNASIVSSVSPQLVEKCKNERIEIKENKIFYLDNVYDEEKFKITDKISKRKEINFNEIDKIIFFAGGLVKVKNVASLIKAFFMVRSSLTNAKLILAGDGIEKNNLIKLTSQSAFENDIFFIGNISETKMIEFYNIADVFCLPSFNEGTPNVIVESLLCGTPVVASNVGGIPNVIKDETNGFLFDPRNVEELSEKLIKALNKKWNKEEVRKSASKFFNENVVENYRKLYSKINQVNT